MKIRLLGALVGLVISFALPIFAQQKETVDPQTIEQLIAVGKKFDEAENNNDAASLAALFTEDAVFVTNTGPVYGRQAIEKWITERLPRMAPQQQAHQGRSKFASHLLGTADSIASSGEWSVIIRGKYGDPIQVKGHFLTIFTRADDIGRSGRVPGT